MKPRHICSLVYLAGWFLAVPAQAGDARQITWFTPHACPEWISAALREAYQPETFERLLASESSVGAIDLALDTESNAEPELIVAWSDMWFCGSGGCSVDVIMRRGSNYVEVGSAQGGGPQSVTVAAGGNKGFRDLVIADRRLVWNGDGYAEEPPAEQSALTYNESCASGSFPPTIARIGRGPATIDGRFSYQGSRDAPLMIFQDDSGSTGIYDGIVDIENGWATPVAGTHFVSTMRLDNWIQLGTVSRVGIYSEGRLWRLERFMAQYLNRAGAGITEHVTYEVAGDGAAMSSMDNCDIWVHGTVAISGQIEQTVPTLASASGLAEAMGARVQLENLELDSSRLLSHAFASGFGERAVLRDAVPALPDDIGSVDPYVLQHAGEVVRIERNRVVLRYLDEEHEFQLSGDTRTSEERSFLDSMITLVRGPDFEDFASAGDPVTVTTVAGQSTALLIENGPIRIPIVVSSEAGRLRAGTPPE